MSEVETNLPEATTESGALPPLCVDLDGTLIRTDLLVESIAKTVMGNPLRVVGLVSNLLESRPALKRYATAHGPPDVALLPYNEELIAALRTERAKGRRLVLATAADSKAAEAVARETGLFDDIIASDSSRNLKGPTKAAVLVERFGEGGFDYCGDSRADLPVWKAARECWVVEDGVNAAQVASTTGNTVARTFAVPRAGLRAWVSAARVYQWAKNSLVFVPAVAAGQIWSIEAIFWSTVAFILFGVFASSSYMVNDLVDLEADRAHPRKRTRAFASGRIKPALGMMFGPSTMLLTVIVAAILAPEFALVLVCYGILTTCYSFGLKTKPLVDVFALAALYSVRIVAGAAITDIEPSIWLLTFSSFLFLALALLKRFTELTDLGTGSGRRGYREGEEVLLMGMGVASSFCTAIVFALYAESGDARLVHEQASYLWGIVPLMLLWQCRLWLVAWRGEMSDDPIVFAARDWASWLIIALCGLLFFLS